MNDQYGSDFMTIVDEDGTEYELEVLTTIEYNGFSYLAVIPADGEKAELAELEVSILKSVDEDGDGSYSEAEAAVAKAKIEEIEQEWLAGDKSEEAFAALANEYSEDDGSNTNGGLYENIGHDDMVAEINDFLFAAGRKTGDTAVLHGNNGSYDGYHLVYFVGEGQLYGLAQAEATMKEDAYNEWEASFAEGVTAEPAGAYKLIGK